MWRFHRNIIPPLRFDRNCMRGLTLPFVAWIVNGEFISISRPMVLHRIPGLVLFLYVCTVLPLPTLAQSSTASAGQVYQQGVRAYEAGDEAAALRSFKKAAELEPSNPEYQNAVGQALLKNGHPSEAIPYFRRS